MIPIPDFVTSVAFDVLKKVSPYLKFIRLKFIRRSQRIRISCAALLVIQKDHKFILIKLLHRPDCLGPIGGVFKYFEDGDKFLQGIEFEPQRPGNFGKDLNYDLRGFIEGRHLLDFVLWFKRGEGREPGCECIHREMIEELRELSIPIDVPNVSTREIELVRRIYEGPKRVPSGNHLQFRILEVYKLRRTPLMDSFVEKIMEVEKTCPDLIGVETDEINLGRMKSTHTKISACNRAVSQTAEYLLRAKSMRPETAPMNH